MIAIYIGNQIVGDTRLIGERMDLFDDEKISLKLNATDLSNIGKSIADFSQPFTIPASPKNRALLKNWHNWRVINSYNANVKTPARLDVLNKIFRTGSFILNESELDNYVPTFYNIQYISNVSNLKETFGDDQLRDIEFVRNPDGSNGALTTALLDLDFNYTADAVYDRINNVDDINRDIVVPVGSVDRLWTYGTGASNDIQYTGTASPNNAITKDELRPAVKVSKILNAIEQRYGLNFSDTFFGGTLFSKLYMWLNRNKIEDVNRSNILIMSYALVNVGTPIENRVSLFGDELRISINTYSQYKQKARFIYVVTPDAGSTTVKYNLRLIDSDGGILKEILNVSGTRTIEYNAYSSNKSPDDVSQFIVGTRLLIQAVSDMEVLVDVRGRLELQIPFVSQVIDDKRSDDNPMSVDGVFPIVTNLPDMKVYDLLTSICKMYNLVIIPDVFNPGTYDFIPSDQYHVEGKLVDYTKYVDPSKVKLMPKKTYKNISFKYEASEFYLNKVFSNTFAREYGNEVYNNILGGSEDYPIEAKFNIMFTALPDTSPYPVFFGLDDKAEQLLNKPVLFYYGGQSDIQSESPDNKIGFVKLDGSGNKYAVPIYSFPLMGTDTYSGNEYQSSLTFSQEYDYNGLLRPNSLFQRYYLNTIETLYNLGTRQFNYQMQLPPHILGDLELSDTIQVGDTLHYIQSVDVDITTGEGSIIIYNIINNGL